MLGSVKVVRDMSSGDIYVPSAREMEAWSPCTIEWQAGLWLNRVEELYGR